MFFKAEPMLDRLIEDVRGKVHEKRLDGLTYLAVLRDPVQVAKGRIVPGRVFEASALIKFLRVAPVDVVIEVGSAIWLAEEMEENHRRALIDHLLTSIVSKKGEGFKVQGPDISEFRQVLDRNGAWNAGLTTFLTNYEKKQRDLVFETDEPDPAAGANVADFKRPTDGKSASAP